MLESLIFVKRVFGNICTPKLLLGVYRNLLEHANFLVYFSLMPEEKAQASLCIGKNSNEPLLL